MVLKLQAPAVSVYCGASSLSIAAQLDIHLLAKERRDKPDDTRVAFYYAQVRHRPACLRPAELLP